MSDDLHRQKNDLDLAVKRADLPGAFSILNEGLRRNRNRTRLLVAGLVLDVVLSFIVAFLGFRTERTANAAKAATTLATRNAAIAKASCLANNVQNAKQIALWEHFFEINPNPTAAEKKQIADARLYVQSIFPQQDCENIAPTGVTPPLPEPDPNPRVTDITTTPPPPKG